MESSLPALRSVHRASSSAIASRAIPKRAPTSTILHRNYCLDHWTTIDFCNLIFKPVSPLLIKPHTSAEIMTWIVVALIGLFSVYSLRGDLFNVAYLRNIVVLAAVYVGWSLIIHTSASDHIPVATAFLVSATRTDLAPLVRDYGMVGSTMVALAWLFHRAVLVLRKSTNDLSGVLGFDIPDRPNLTLVEIRADAVTLTWSQSSPVQRYLIEVNGIIIGDFPGHETAITVTGLRPNHFYNIRVIAVSVSKFRSGSRTIRVETHAADGMPVLDSRLVPEGYLTRRKSRHAVDMQPREGSSLPIPDTPAAEAITVSDATVQFRSRRNTSARKRSASAATLESTAAVTELTAADVAVEISIAELTVKQDQIRRETDEIALTIAAEEEDGRRQYNDHCMVKEEQLTLLRARTEVSRKLRSDTAKSDSATQEARSILEQKKRAIDREKAEKIKLEAQLQKLAADITAIRGGRVSFGADYRQALQSEYEQKTEILKDMAMATRADMTKMEKDLKVKRERLDVVELSNKSLPLSKDDPAWKHQRLQAKHDLDRKNTALSNQLGHVHRRTKELERLVAAVQANPQHATTASWGNLGKDREFAGQKRRSRTNTMQPSTPRSSASPSGVVVGSGESTFASSMPITASSPVVGPPWTKGPPPGFEPKIQAELGTESTMNKAPPLSPSAAAFLPRGILGEDDTSTKIDACFGPELSSMSPNVTVPSNSLSRASTVHHGSLQHLPTAFSSDPSLQGHLLRPSATAPVGRPTSTQERFAGLLGRSKNRTGKSLDEGGPLLGSLKPEASRSHPHRASAEDDPMGKKRIWGLFGTKDADGRDAFNASPSGASTANRGFHTPPSTPGSSFRFPVRDAVGTGRPSSLGYADMSRPITESQWGNMSPVHPGGLDPWRQQAINSQDQARRTSVQLATSTSLASPDDIILDPSDLRKPETSPSQVGVIGSGPKKPATKLVSSFVRLKGDKGESNVTPMMLGSTDVSSSLPHPVPSGSTLLGPVGSASALTDSSHMAMSPDFNVAFAPSKDPDSLAKKVLLKGSSGGATKWPTLFRKKDKDFEAESEET